MEIIYALEQIPYKLTKSIFLAGPIPRDKETKSWRPDAIQILQDIGFENGTIFNPETRNGKWHGDHEKQIEWEENALNLADIILFWIPRNLKTLHGLSTNIEWGRWENSGKVVVGWPEDAERMNYIGHYAKKFNIEPKSTLTETIEEALAKLGDGVVRTNGDRYINLFLWKLPSFQNWFDDLKNSGNRLESCETILYLPTPKNPSAAIWIIRPNVFLPKEDRYKKNEIVIGRPDLSSVCMYKDTGDDIEIVLVKEFRSSVSNDDGMVWELPSGGFLAEQTHSHQENACNEVKEETGFDLDDKKLQFGGARQMASTMMSFKSHLFSYRLDQEELEWFKSQKGIAKGIKKEGERCFVEVVRLNDIKAKNLVDWSVLGQILSVVRYDD